MLRWPERAAIANALPSRALKARRLPQSQRFNHRSIDLASGVQSLIALVPSQSISSPRTQATINGAMVVPFPGQCCLDLAHAGIRVGILILGLRRILL